MHRSGPQMGQGRRGAVDAIRAKAENQRERKKWLKENAQTTISLWFDQNDLGRPALCRILPPDMWSPQEIFGPVEELTLIFWLRRSATATVPNIGDRAVLEMEGWRGESLIEKRDQRNECCNPRNSHLQFWFWFWFWNEWINKYINNINKYLEIQ